MLRGCSIKFALAFMIVASTWVVQESLMTQTAGANQEKFSSKTPDDAAQEGINFLKKQFKVPTPPAPTPPRDEPRTEAPGQKDKKDKKSDDKKRMDLNGMIKQRRLELESAAMKVDMAEKEAKAEQYAKELGFKSAAEARKAEKAKDGFKIYRVWPQTLVDFNKDGNPEDLLKDTHTKIYAVYVPKEGSQDMVIRSSITVAEALEKPSNGWDWIERGSPRLIRGYEQYKEKFKAYEVVEVGKNLHFLKAGAGKDIKLIPIYNVKLGELELEMGVAKPASEIFYSLAQIIAKRGAAERTTGKGVLR